MIVAVKGRPRGMLLAAGGLALASLAAGAVFGGPLALLLAGPLGLRGWGAIGAGALGGVLIGLLELALLVWFAPKSSFRKLAALFSSAGAWAGVAVGYFAA